MTNRTDVPIRLYILDTDGNQIASTDTLDTLDYATNLRFSSVFPRGYDSCSFRVRRRDIFGAFDVREAYAVLVRAGQQLVFDGRIERMNKVLSGGDEYIDIEAAGWYVVLNERRLQKRWHDPAAIAHLIDNGNDAINPVDPDMKPAITRRRNLLRINVAPSVSDVTYDEARHKELYTMPGVDNYIYKVTCENYKYRTGEGFKLRIWNVDDSSTEEEDSRTSVAEATASFAGPVFTANTTSFRLDTLTYGVSDQFDFNDWVEYTHLEVFAQYESGHSNTGDPTDYYISDLVEDCLLIADRAGSQISGDYSQLETINEGVDGFCVESPTAISEVIDRICSYGTSSNETISFSVWGRDGTTDDLPRPVLETYPSTTDYEYWLDVNDETLRTFQNSLDTSQIYNWIWLNYTDSEGVPAYLTPDDYSGLKDDTSIAKYGRRESPVLKIGKSPDDATALNIGYRYLEYHKDARYRGSLAVVGWINNKDGSQTPASQIRAGQRVYIPQLDTVFVMRSVAYDAESQIATISPDMPPNSVNLMIDDLRRQIEAAEVGFEKLGR